MCGWGLSPLGSLVALWGWGEAIPSPWGLLPLGWIFVSVATGEEIIRILWKENIIVCHLWVWQHLGPIGYSLDPREVFLHIPAPCCTSMTSVSLSSTDVPCCWGKWWKGSWSTGWEELGTRTMGCSWRGLDLQLLWCCRGSAQYYQAWCPHRDSSFRCSSLGDLALAAMDWAAWTDVSLSPSMRQGFHLVTSFEGAVFFPVLPVPLCGAHLLLQLGTTDAPLVLPLSASPC